MHAYFLYFSTDFERKVGGGLLKTNFFDFREIHACFLSYSAYLERKMEVELFLFYKQILHSFDFTKCLPVFSPIRQTWRERLGIVLQSINKSKFIRFHEMSACFLSYSADLERNVRDCLSVRLSINKSHILYKCLPIFSPVRHTWRERLGIVYRLASL